MAPLSRGTLILLVAVFANGDIKTKGESLDQYRYCSRACVPGSVPKKCRYEFFVDELPNLNSVCYASPGNNTQLRPNCPDGFPGNRVLGINGMTPGPQIEICLGDTLEVVLENGLATGEVTLHWHGLRQKGSAHMDGVPLVTQCPVLPFSSFQYEMKPESPGTYLYYAQSAAQQGDGLYGALIVHDAGDDPRTEKTLIFSTMLQVPLTQLWPEVSVPIDLLVNGEKDGYRLHVNEKTRYLMRLINANAVACPIAVSIAAHELLVVAVDGVKVKSQTPASHVVLFPGERFEAILDTNQRSGRYLIRIQGMGECRNLFHSASLDYEESSRSSSVLELDNHLSQNDVISLEKGYDCHKVSKNIVCSLDTDGVMDESINNDPDETFYVSFDINTVDNVNDEMTDFGYNLEESAHYPTYLSMSTEGVRVAQINGMTFQYPTSPILSQPENIPDEMLCSIEEKSQFCIANTPRFCECLQILEVSVNKTIEIVVIDEGFGGNTSHTFHVHGHHVNVVGVDGLEKSITRAEVNALDVGKALPRNLINPPKKDTFTVPNKGYTIVRFRSDNLGYWLWEARSTGISPAFSPGMQFLMQVGARENMPTVPIDFPTCGSNKKPDMIFENN